MPAPMTILLPAPLFPVALLPADVPLAVWTAPAEEVIPEPEPEPVPVVVAPEPVDETAAEMGVEVEEV